MKSIALVFCSGITPSAPGLFNIADVSVSTVQAKQLPLRFQIGIFVLLRPDDSDDLGQRNVTLRITDDKKVIAENVGEVRIEPDRRRVQVFQVLTVEAKRHGRFTVELSDDRGVITSDWFDVVPA